MQSYDLSFQCKTHILLTGAGFTHNFGAPLASQMWANLLSHPAVQSSNEIRELLLEDLDFESVYEQVTTSDKYETDSKEAIRTAIKDIFIDVDSIIREYGTGLGKPPVQVNGVNELISMFEGNNIEKGFFFTLNQDLYVERKYFFHQNISTVTLPGVSNVEIHSRVISDDDYMDITQRQAVEEAQKSLNNSRNQFFYLKLHGSQNWISKTTSGGLVIGKAKTKQIAVKPLLHFYYNIFKSVLNLPSRKLLSIGYGFRDQHINDAIHRAAKNHGLELYIISPESPESFRERMYRENQSIEIWKSIRGYYNSTLSEFFPGGGPPFGTTKYRNLLNEFFAS